MFKQALVILAVVIAFGILEPLYKGIGFLDARIIAAYACLAVLFVAPASAELASAGKNAPASTLLARIAIIVAWGWGITVLILATAIVTLNVMAPRGGFAAPPTRFLTGVLIFSLIASVAIALLGAVLARRFSAAQIKNMLRAGFLLILLVILFGSRVLPESLTIELSDRFATRTALTHLAWQGSAVFGALAAVLLIALVMTSARPPFASTASPSAKIPMAENPDQGGR
jgi:hypothetical protein